LIQEFERNTLNMRENMNRNGKMMKGKHTRLVCLQKFAK